MTPLLKNLLIGLGLALLILLGVYLYQQRDITGNLVSVNSRVNNQAALETQDFLRRLQELRSVDLDDSLFFDDRFRSLIDWHIDVVPEQIGRENPFSPVGETVE